MSSRVWSRSDQRRQLRRLAGYTPCLDRVLTEMRELNYQGIAVALTTRRSSTPSSSPSLQQLLQHEKSAEKPP